VLPKLIATEQLYKYFKFYFHQKFSCVYLKRKYQFERNCSCHAITLSRDATLRDGDPFLLFHTPLRHFLILFNYYNIDLVFYFLCLRFLRVNFFFFWKLRTGAHTSFAHFVHKIFNSLPILLQHEEQIKYNPTYWLNTVKICCI